MWHSFTPLVTSCVGVYMYFKNKLHVFGCIYFFNKDTFHIRDKKGSNYNSTYHLTFNFEYHMFSNVYVCTTSSLYSTTYLGTFEIHQLQKIHTFGCIFFYKSTLRKRGTKVIITILIAT
jgi:hypothetical protein